MRVVGRTRCGQHARRARRRALQQQERRAEEYAADNCSNAEAPPPSALVPQGSTLLRGHSAPAPTHGWRGVLKKLDNQLDAVQTEKGDETLGRLFPQVTNLWRVIFR